MINGVPRGSYLDKNVCEPIRNSADNIKNEVVASEKGCRRIQQGIDQLETWAGK